MNNIDLVRYIIVNYPAPDELSKARLNKIMYLVDWKSAIENAEQITNINWIFNHYGPYVNDIENIIIEDPRFNIQRTNNIYGKEKNIIRLEEDSNFREPTENEKNIIDFVIEKTKKFNWKKFIELVYSTYPIISQERGTTLNLVELAREYNAMKN
jgi:uncharacterized protein YwgA